MRRARHGRIESVQDALGIAAVGAGYILRTDGIAIGLAEVTPPDLRLYDEPALALLLDSYAAVLRASGERMLLSSYAVPPDLHPLVTALETARRRARDWTSFAVLDGLAGLLASTMRAFTAPPSVRWILAVPSVAPEQPPRGTWGELFPSAIVGRLARLPGDPIAEALARTRRLVDALAALGTEPPPRLLTAVEIQAVLALALDPIQTQTHPPVANPLVVRPLQLAVDDPAPVCHQPAAPPIPRP